MGTRDSILSELNAEPLVALLPAEGAAKAATASFSGFSFFKSLSHEGSAAAAAAPAAAPSAAADDAAAAGAASAAARSGRPQVLYYEQLFRCLLTPHALVDAYTPQHSCSTHRHSCCCYCCFAAAAASPFAAVTAAAAYVHACMHLSFIFFFVLQVASEVAGRHSHN